MEYINMKEVDCYIACLPRQLHVVKTVESILNNKEIKTITITANKYTDELFQELTTKLLNLNAQYQVPIYLHRGDNLKESNEKLKYISKGNGRYISFVDDDLILNPNHFEFLIGGCEAYNAYVSLHGVVLYPRPIKSYYRDRFVYRGLGTVIDNYEVDIVGNGCGLFKREFFTEEELKSLYDDAPTQGMDDILMATLCKNKGIKRVVLAHPEGFVKHKEIRPDDEYIFDKYALRPNGDEVQTNYINLNWK